jgi:hypothetical protein
MSRRRERRFSSAHAIAIAALFFALGGGAYAAVSSLPANSVGTKQLRNHSVTPVKLAQSRRAIGLTPRQKKEIKKLAKTYSRMGPAGRQGPKGDAGSPGATGPSDVYIGGAAGGSLSGSYAVVASTQVPPGEYLIQAKTDIFNGTPGEGGSGNCEILPELGAGAWDGASAAFPGIVGQITSASISLAGAVSLPSGSTIALACKSNQGSLSVDDARVWATRVGSLHGLPVPID